jgi:protocatechuate 4,5-dioxygenase alpha chain
MASQQHDYDDIPGTFVFDAERSRKGYGINMFCMSLLKKENREAFKANEAEYLKQFHMTTEQEDAVLKRDYNRMLELGGNIYFTAKLGATDGHSFQHLAAVMTGSTQQQYADMMLHGGRNVEGNRSRTGRKTPVAAMFIDDKPAKPAVKRAKPAAKKAAKKAVKKSAKKVSKKAPKKAAKKSTRKSAAKSKSAKKRK